MYQQIGPSREVYYYLIGTIAMFYIGTVNEHFVVYFHPVAVRAARMVMGIDQQLALRKRLLANTLGSKRKLRSHVIETDREEDVFHLPSQHFPNAINGESFSVGLRTNQLRSIVSRNEEGKALNMILGN